MARSRSASASASRSRSGSQASAAAEEQASKGRGGGGRSRSPSASPAGSAASSGASSASSGDDEPAKLHVSGLSRNVTAEHLREIFGTFGGLRDVELAMDRRVGLSRGFGYVEFEHRREAEGACVRTGFGLSWLMMMVVGWDTGARGRPWAAAHMHVRAQT